MDQYSRGLPLSSIVPAFPHANIDAFWGPYDSAESAMVYPVPSGQGLAQGVIPVSARVSGLEFGVKVMNGSQLVRIEKYQVTGVQTYKKLILTEDDINLPQDIAEVFVCHNDAQGYDDLNAAVQAGKVIMWEGNVVNVLHNSTQGVYRLSYVGGDGLVHCYNVFSSSPSAATKENIPLARADEYLNYGSGTTFVELNSWVSSHKPVKVNGYVANVVQDSQTQYTLKYVDGEGVLHIITHTSSDTPTTATKDLSESVHIDADNVNKVFAIKDNKGTTIGSIALGTNTTNGAAELTFVAGSNQFTASLPNLDYDSSRQMLKYIDANGDDHDLIRLSNLQIKEVIAYQGSVSFTPAMGDLILEANSVGDGYILEVFDGTNWQPLGRINNVSLQADQVRFNASGYSATNVKDAIIEANPVKDSNASSDLDIADGNGKALVRFGNGHIKTQNFDSSVNAMSAAEKEKLNGIEEGAEVNNLEVVKSKADLDFADENGKSVLRVNNGHIKTEHFDSENIDSDVAQKVDEYLQYLRGGAATSIITGVPSASDIAINDTIKYLLTKCPYADIFLVSNFYSNSSMGSVGSDADIKNRKRRAYRDELRAFADFYSLGLIDLTDSGIRRPNVADISYYSDDGVHANTLAAREKQSNRIYGILTQRCGSETNLLNKKILLLGDSSVGGDSSDNRTGWGGNLKDLIDGVSGSANRGNNVTLKAVGGSQWTEKVVQGVIVKNVIQQIDQVSVADLAAIDIAIISSGGNELGSFCLDYSSTMKYLCNDTTISYNYNTNS